MPFFQPTGVAVDRPSGVASVVDSFNEKIKSSSSSISDSSSYRKKNTEKSCRIINSWVKSSTNQFSSPTKGQPSAPHRMGKNTDNNDGTIWIFTKTWQPVGVSVQSVVVFVHDVAEHCERYQPMFAAFAGKGIEVQSFDLPGFGETGVRADAQGITGGYDALLKEIDSAIDRASAAHFQKPVFLMGHGMGGALALNYVCGLGLRITSLAGLISSSPYLKPTLAGAGSRFPGTYNRLGKWYPHLSIGFPVMPVELTRDLKEQERHREDGMILDSVSMQCLGDMIYQGQKVLKKRWKHFPAQLPTLLVHGTADPICTFAATHQLSQQIIQKLKPTSFVFKSWKGSMHDPHWDLDAQSVRSEYVHWIRSNYRHFVKAPLEPEMVASIMIKSARTRSRQSSIAAAQREKVEEKHKKKLAKEKERACAPVQGDEESTPMDSEEIAMATASAGSEAFTVEQNSGVKKTKDKKKVKAEKPKKLSKAEKKQLELDQKNALQNQIQEQPPAPVDVGSAVVNTAPGDEAPQVLAPVPQVAQTNDHSFQTSSLPSQAAVLHSALLTAASMRPKILSLTGTTDSDQISTLPDSELGAKDTETLTPVSASVAVVLNSESEADPCSTEIPLENDPANVSTSVCQDDTNHPVANEREVTATETVSAQESELGSNVEVSNDISTGIPTEVEETTRTLDHSSSEQIPEEIQEPTPTPIEANITSEPQVPEISASPPSVEPAVEVTTPPVTDILT